MVDHEEYCRTQKDQTAFLIGDSGWKAFHTVDNPVAFALAGAAPADGVGHPS